MKSTACLSVTDRISSLWSTHTYYTYSESAWSWECFGT